MSRAELLFAIGSMIGLEITHLKWIWWNHWDCRRCGRKNRECGHASKWMLLL